MGGAPRRFAPLVYPQVKRCGCVPEGRPEISRWWSPSVTTGVGQNRFCVPAGTPDQDSQQCQCCSGALPGRACFCRCVSGGYAALHHRLISAAPPAQRFVGKLIVCPTLASRFSFLQRAATGMNDSCKGVGISSSAVPGALPSDACPGVIFIISARRHVRPERLLPIHVEWQRGPTASSSRPRLRRPGCGHPG